jgi:hypothetical protein
MTGPTEGVAWRDVDPSRAGALVDARLQFHHAAQLATALGISYLPAQPDDSHTNLEWLPEIEALASNAVREPTTLRLAVRPNPLAVLVLDETNSATATLLLNGRRLDGAALWIRSQLDEHGIDSARYTLRRHYTIPPHPVADHAAFDATNAGEFEQLAAWYSNAAGLFTALASATPGASVVRCWPHHFDIATLIEVATGRTVGVGMEPGDVYYAEPYFYVNMSPQPAPDAARRALDGGGAWHTHEWIGAVLPASALATTNQQRQCKAFLRSAIAACSAILAGAS